VSASVSGSISALNDAGFSSLVMTSASSRKKGDRYTLEYCAYSNSPVRLLLLDCLCTEMRTRDVNVSES